MLPAPLKEAFNQGLVAAASSSNSWVITGGTDTGVMNLVGQGLYDAGTNGKVGLPVAPQSQDLSPPPPARTPASAHTDVA